MEAHVVSIQEKRSNRNSYDRSIMDESSIQKTRLQEEIYAQFLKPKYKHVFL